jgi:hypothetical protein
MCEGAQPVGGQVDLTAVERERAARRFTDRPVVVDHEDAQE